VTAVEPLPIAGVWTLTPQVHADDRGDFLEWYRAGPFAAALGSPMPVVQANLSRSRRGVVRGIHLTEVPPGQAKHVTCVAGAVLDVVVDVRVGSPTFGRWTAVELDAVTHRAVYVGAGLGHGLQALTDDATVAYLCSAEFDPAVERGIHPLDPDVGIAWPVPEPLLSPRDAGAPTLAEARAAGWLPSWPG
jgi:dTDP-4-dehydrorhamnose 3,5-epimerase